MDVFPEIKTMEWNNKKTPSYDVVVQQSGSKRRKTMVTHAYPEWTLECSFTALDRKQIDKIYGFYCAQSGGAKPFLWFDMEDNKQVGIKAVGDGVTEEFQLYRSLGGLFYEPVRDIVANSLVLWLGSSLATGYTLENGKVIFGTAPAAGTIVTADFRYYWRVAFDDAITSEIFWYNLYKLNSFKLVTVR
ncbi:DUF2460 domain-containing protein [Anaeromusa sp.]|uniref:DUF2460 domain-containing protein n=1 Tax=Anaeromusa sp. TaxID=1872520 RepID=UPI0026315FA2|nr:DUF2460 domain-containing protein [Anaeromusa sp.]MDD3157661.1 DUF2460 domain-containing protein [Anaeromusa sp.]